MKVSFKEKSVAFAMDKILVRGDEIVTALLESLNQLLQQTQPRVTIVRERFQHGRRACQYVQRPVTLKSCKLCHSNRFGPLLSLI